VCQYLFDEKLIYADIYWCYDRIMAYGMRNMFQITKDLAVLKKEIVEEMKLKRDKKEAAGKGKSGKGDNVAKQSQLNFDREVRQRLEKACEEER